MGPGLFVTPITINPLEHLFPNVGYRVLQNTIGPGLINGIVESPVLAIYFSGLDPTGLYPNPGPVDARSLGIPDLFIVIFLISASFILGFLVQDARRAILTFTLSQVTAISLALIPLFIYPGTIQTVLKIIMGFGYGMPDQAASTFGVLILSYSILIVLFGNATSAIGALVAEHLAEQGGGYRMSNTSYRISGLLLVILATLSVLFAYWLWTDSPVFHGGIQGLGTDMSRTLALTLIDPTYWTTLVLALSASAILATLGAIALRRSLGIRK